MKRLAVVLLLVAVACTGGDDAAAGNLIAVQTADGNIVVIDPETGIETRLTFDGGTTTLYSQPTWSPDGSQLAFVQSGAAAGPGQFAAGGAVRVGLQAQAINSSIHILTMGEEITDVEVETPIAGFYLYWSPDGSSLAFLGSDFSGIGLGVIDISTGTFRRIDGGQPYYFAWSPDSDRVLSHVGGDVYFLSTDGLTDDFPIDPGGFSAPGWEGGSLLYSVVRDDGNLLVLATTDGEETREILEYPDEVAAELSADGKTVAYVDIRAGSAQPALGPLIADTVDGRVEVAPEVTAFFWSRDGTHLLYLAPDRTSEDLLLQWGVWDGTTTTTFEGFVPSATLVARYLPFFSQYSNSHSFLSPDNKSFVFAGEVGGESGVWIQKIEEGVPAQRVTDGVVATWAP